MPWTGPAKPRPRWLSAIAEDGARNHRPNRHGRSHRHTPCLHQRESAGVRVLSQRFQGLSLQQSTGRLDGQAPQRADAGWPACGPTAPPFASLRVPCAPRSAGRLRSLSIAAPAALHRSSSPVCRKRQTSPAALRCSAAHTGRRPATLHQPAPPSTASIPPAQSPDTRLFEPAGPNAQEQARLYSAAFTWKESLLRLRKTLKWLGLVRDSLCFVVCAAAESGSAAFARCF